MIGQQLYQCPLSLSFSLTLSHPNTHHPRMHTLPNKHIHTPILIFIFTLTLSNLQIHVQAFINRCAHLLAYTNFLSRCLGNHKLYRGNNKHQFLCQKIKVVNKTIPKTINGIKTRENRNFKTSHLVVWLSSASLRCS